MDDPDWVISVAAGWVLHAYFQEVVRISDLFRR
jgi:hypothetical protein